jgi:hypothetical protein
MLAAGMRVPDVARESGVNPNTVAKWKARQAYKASVPTIAYVPTQGQTPSHSQTTSNVQAALRVQVRRNGSDSGVTSRARHKLSVAVESAADNVLREKDLEKKTRAIDALSRAGRNLGLWGEDEGQVIEVLGGLSEQLTIDTAPARVIDLEPGVISAPDSSEPKPGV